MAVALLVGMEPNVRPPKGHPGRRLERSAWAVALLIALGAAVAFIWWSSGAERRALEGMDPVQRRAVYEEAFGEFERLCGAGPRYDALEKRCVEESHYLIQFPECDARCQGIARSHTPLPTK